MHIVPLFNHSIKTKGSKATKLQVTTQFTTRLLQI